MRPGLLAPSFDIEGIWPLTFSAQGQPPALGLLAEGCLSWSRALEWSCTHGDAEAAFVLDLDCRILALAGSIGAQQAELLAPRLLSALEQLGLVGSRVVDVSLKPRFEQIFTLVSQDPEDCHEDHSHC